VSDFAERWSTALAQAAYVPLPWAERERILDGFAERLRQAATSTDPDPAETQRVGADLVAAGFRTPEVLGRTVTLVTTHLAPAIGLTGSRLTLLVEGLATGFTRALRSHTLDEQEEMRLAATRAQLRAEHALDTKEAEFRHFVAHDQITGLPNRAAFTQQVADRLTSPHGDRLVVCCLDVDRFNPVNDTLGHPAGDQLLAAIADRLRVLAASLGGLAARLEGDEFAVLIEPAVAWEEDVERVFRAFARPFHLAGVELSISVSAGVAETGADRGDPSHYARAHGLIQQAQAALHWAKADGRARWRVFRPDRAVAAADRYRLSADIPKGLRRGEFTLHYQPLVDLATGEVVGAEALARWHHPERGLLPAGHFIGLVEHTGLIVPLGNHLLAEACRQAAARWQTGDRQPYVSVNVSGAQLQRPGFVAYIARMLDRHGLAPSRLQIEVTEEAIVETAKATAALDALLRLGVRIAVDDFGTGHSNLLRLRELPFHCLKLDAAFVQSHRPQPTTMDRGAPAEFLAATVALGHTLRLEVTAEGLESADDVARARAAGCDVGQGWHFGHPRPAEEIFADAPGGTGPDGFSPTLRRRSAQSAPAWRPARRS
jgi:diguanylate cyclase